MSRGSDVAAVAASELRAAFDAAVEQPVPLEALVAVRDLREQLGSWEALLARRALAAGETWESIGDALGTSRQAAWERLRPGVAALIEQERARLEAERRRVLKSRRRQR